MEKLRWFLIAVFFVVTVIASFDLGPVINLIMPILVVVTLSIASFLHGLERYGLKNMLVFFGFTCVISLFFEALSIQTGFPFGFYNYDKLLGPRIFEVPVVIVFAYFSMAYVSWMLAHVLLNQYSVRLQGSKIFLVAFVAAFVMVMWDLCMDPLASTIGQLWVWREPGSYYGVPLSNYFGWFLVVYLIFQSFAVYISKNDISISDQKEFWYEAATLYAIQGLFMIMSPLTVEQHPDIYGPMALVTVFTMMFVAMISFILIHDRRPLGGRDDSQA
jgi:putative membrane protein